MTAETEAVRFERPAGPLLIALSFIALTAWSWQKWADVHLDYGTELYLPWQILDGRALYLDLAHKNGPLSPYLNALFFRLFGVSVATLSFANLAILAGICALVWQLFARACDRFTACVVCLVFLGVFAFSQYTLNASFNYVAPYQHHQTHGLALSLAMLCALGSCLRAPSLVRVALASACLGLVFLTKAEIFVPAAAAWMVGQALILRGMETRARARTLAVSLLALALPVGVAFCLLATRMPSAVAWRGVLGNWGLFGTGLASSPFYVSGAGLDEPWRNLLHTFLPFAATIGIVAAVAALGARVPALRGRAAPRIVGAGLFGLLALIPAERAPWIALERSLPLMTLSALGGFGLALRRSRDDRERFVRWAPLLLWAVFALGLLGKLGLEARVHQYGFVLAMPALLLGVAGLVHLLPHWLGARGGALLRATGLAVTAALVLFHSSWSNRFYALKDFAVGEGADRVLALSGDFDPRGQAIGRTLALLDARLPKEATLAVLPEGVAINYWLRRPNPARFQLFVPPEFDAFGGEAVLLADLVAHPADFVVLLDRRHAVFGVGPFGTPGNGRDILGWVRRDYETLARIGGQPFLGNAGFAVEVLRRRVH